MKTENQFFNRTDRVLEGWYWVLKASHLRPGQVKSITLMGKDLVLFRGKTNGRVALMDAYCAHMGAHLGEGRVEGDSLRCFFHNWKYAQNGSCTQIPSLGACKIGDQIKVRSWHTEEKFGLIWVWTGKQEPAYAVPQPEELMGQEYDFNLGTSFKKGCHPHVVLINAIDEQHFNSVHNLPVPLYMEVKVDHRQRIAFDNVTHVKPTNWINKLLLKLYKTKLTYSLTYWNGSVGCVTLGPDFLHFYVMFALRFNQEGHSEGQSILVTKKRKGFWGYLINKALLGVTQVVAFYFAVGDTKVFNTIKFNLKTPIGADHAVVDFIKHIENQPEAEWFDSRDIAEKVFSYES